MGYLTTVEVAAQVGLSLSNFNVLRHRHKATFPPPSISIGRHIGWTTEDVEAVRQWLQAHPRAV